MKYLIILAIVSGALGQRYIDGSGGYVPIRREQPVFRPVYPNSGKDVIEMPRQELSYGGQQLSMFAGRRLTQQRPLAAEIPNELTVLVRRDNEISVPETSLSFGGNFDYERGCCRRQWPGCRRPLCSAPGFDYYDEVHHCCHRRTSGCHHRPLCEYDYGYYNRRHHCCYRRTRGCHRPLCGWRHHHHRHHHHGHSCHNRRSHSHSSDRSSRHHSSSSSDESRVHRRSGSRSNEHDSKYPAYFPYLFNNGTRQVVNQHVNVAVHQDQRAG